MRIAVALFDVCERSFWHWTTMPVGRCVMRTAESVLFTCCPPAPLERYVSMRSSDSSISTGASSGRSGATTICANAVCRRWAESNGDWRTRRCTPRSAFSVPYAFSPLTVTVADLRPASSPGLASIVSVWKPRSAAQRRYMPQQHVGPVLRVGSARARVDLEDGVARVVLAVEERVLLQTSELALERRDELRDLLLVLAEREQLRRVLELALEPLVALELADEPRVLGRDASRTRLVVPEPGSAHRLLELDASRR